MPENNKKNQQIHLDSSKVINLELSQVVNSYKQHLKQLKKINKTFADDIENYLYKLYNKKSLEIYYHKLLIFTHLLSCMRLETINNKQLQNLDPLKTALNSLKQSLGKNFCQLEKTHQRLMAKYLSTNQLSSLSFNLTYQQVKQTKPVQAKHTYDATQSQTKSRANNTSSNALTPQETLPWEKMIYCAGALFVGLAFSVSIGMSALLAIGIGLGFALMVNCYLNYRAKQSKKDINPVPDSSYGFFACNSQQSSSIVNSVKGMFVAPFAGITLTV